MKFKELPSVDTTLKLIQISFSEPEKNIEMYKLYVKLRDYQSFLENEKNKLLKKYGKEEKNEQGKYKIEGENVALYRNDLSAILESDMPDDIESPGFDLDDFTSEKCSYPTDKMFWPNAADISAFLSFCDKLKK